ncbi:MAG: DUF116 domain-containing protein [Alphaproteobacteria bacterium]|uniref:DUF116 domain-containing protein n=1 Tax=Candidatus Nitrobium versatile TaxID=2884831 RepID=A0A953M343_9BACT|nr:DUF116 domain-containing protein [Candidatus Nitrobium versatile]
MPKDRKLGNEWADWKGEAGSLEQDLDERLSVFFLLAVGIVIFLIILLPAVWYLVRPRIMQLHPGAAQGAEWLLGGGAVLFMILVSAEGISLFFFERTLLPYRWTEKFLLFLLPGAVWLGAKLGISRDRVGNSFIKVHNLVTRLSTASVRAEKLLVLLPRCLRKEIRTGIIRRLEGYEASIVTAGGGEEAREAIRQYRPTLILALACERDLMSGIKDVAERIPVIGIPNKRPEGPCKNTHISFEDLEEALHCIHLSRKKE